MKQRIRLTESQLHRVIKESVKKVLREAIDPVYDELSRPNGKSDITNPYTWVDSLGGLKKMGYDENGMRRGKKYYDRLINPNWRFTQDRGWDNAMDYVYGRNETIEKDLAHQEELRNAADERWNHAADSRPLHRKGSLNREGWSDPRK